jgi:hypothetical protein
MTVGATVSRTLPYVRTFDSVVLPPVSVACTWMVTEVAPDASVGTVTLKLS